LTLSDVLINTAYNPIPEGAVADYATTPDRYKIRYARWPTSQYPCKGTIVLLSGRAEYIEKHCELIENLLGMGFEVLSFDWRGQGGSDRVLENSRAGYIDDFEDYVKDLDTIMDQVALPDCTPPYYILGHSTGALVALLSAPNFANRIRRMVLSSPLLGIGPQPIAEPFVRTIAGTLTFVGLGETYLGSGATPTTSRPFAGNMLTSDVERFERMKQFIEEHRELSTGGTTSAWVFAAMRAMDRVNDPDFHRMITIPTLLISASADTVVNNQAIENLGRRLRSGYTLSVSGAKHELFHENDLYREQMLAAIEAFIPGSDAD